MKWILLILFTPFFPHAVSASPPAGCTGDSHYCDGVYSCAYERAVGFPLWDQLEPSPAKLIESYAHTQTGVLDAADFYESWIDRADGEAATFLAIHHAFEHLSIQMEDGSLRNGMDLIVSVRSFAGDRVSFEFDAYLMSRWIAAGAKFRLADEDGEIETGAFKFDRGDHGGKLHKGYSIQGYTSITKVPRIQINYRYKDHQADVDLDGYQPWLGGWLPNPLHMTYENSDVRQWYSKYVRKYGSPGFTTQDYSWSPPRPKTTLPRESLGLRIRFTGR